MQSGVQVGCLVGCGSEAVLARVADGSSKAGLCVAASGRVMIIVPQFPGDPRLADSVFVLLKVCPVFVFKLADTWSGTCFVLRSESFGTAVLTSNDASGVCEVTLC